MIYLLGRAVRTGLKLALLAGLAAVALLVLALERAPRVTGTPVADAGAAARTLELARQARDFAVRGEPASSYQVGEQELNDALAAGARVLPGFAGRARVGADGVGMEASLPVPRTPLWLNVSGRVAEGPGLVVEAARIGRLPVPSVVVRAAMRIALDRELGDGLGRIALDSVGAVETAPPEVTVRVALAPGEGELVADRLRSALHARAGTGDAERTERHLAALAAARAEGRLEEGGSFVAYLREAVEEAARAAEGAGVEAARAEMRGALYALAIACGDPRFSMAIGANRAGAAGACAGVTLGGRRDLMQHFAVSAGLLAATSQSAALGVGELKELLDSGQGGSGFSFDDMAANLAGARFAEAVLQADPAAWPAFAAALESGGEQTIMPPFDDLPAGLDEAEFRERFGSVEDAAYQELLAEVMRRVDALPLYRTAMN